MIEIADRADLDPLDKWVRIEARRWIMSKVSPGRYGDKIVVGGDGSLGIGGSWRSRTSATSNWRPWKRWRRCGCRTMRSSGRG
jgi:hypothetical protein